MKRKIVQQGYSTLMVSLPASWTKKHGIQKGDEVDLNEEEDTLMIGTYEKKKVKKEITIDIDNVNPLVNRLIMSAYKKGYDTIKINFSNQKLLQKIQKESLLELIGFEIIDQGKNYCIISEVSTTTEEEFENILKRIFYTNKNMLSELIKSLEEKEEDLSYISAMDFNINKYVNFCERVINKELYKGENDNILYFVIISLDSLGDSIKQLVKLIGNNKNRLNDEEFDLLKDTFNIFDQFINLYYNVNLEKTIKFSKDWQHVYDKHSFESPMKYKLKEILVIIIKMFEHSLTTNIDRY